MKKKQIALKISDITRTATKADGTKLPVIDAPHDTLIQPNAADIKNGIKGDHANCMYCLACRRLFDSELVWVTRGLAYVEILGPNGKPQLQRFILEKPARAAVKGFDAGTYCTPEAVVFAAPRGTRKLYYQRQKWHENKKKAELKTQHKAAYVKGESSPSPFEELPRPKRKVPTAFDEARDRATGMFQFGLKS